MPDALETLTNEETAALLGVRPQTLLTWRCQGRGPRYLKVGRRCYYRRPDVETWLQGQLRDPAKHGAVAESRA